LILFLIGKVITELDHESSDHSIRLVVFFKQEAILHKGEPLSEKRIEREPSGGTHLLFTGYLCNVVKVGAKDGLNDLQTQYIYIRMEKSVACLSMRVYEYVNSLV